MLNNRFLLVFYCIFLFLSSFADVVTYPIDNSDSSIPLSDFYEVTVLQDGNVYETMTYMSRSDAELNGRNRTIVDNTISWSEFSFENDVTVRVKVKSGQSKITNSDCIILPSRFGIEATKVSDDEIEFTIEDPGQYSVEFGFNGYKNGLMIFADPMEDDQPDKDAANVKYCDECSASDINGLSSSINTIYFNATRHTIGIYELPAHIKNIYIEGGAVVRGMLHMDGGSNSNVKIYGRGMLDGRTLIKDNAIEAKGGANNITVEGITVSQSRKFAVRLLGNNNNIHWVKTPGGWNFNNDGLVGYENTHISHCFVWANDDGIKLYRDNQLVHDIVSWHLTNGAVFQWCWNSVDAKNIRVKDVDVLRGLWPADGGNQGVFCARGYSTNNGSKTQNDWVFENIKVETPVKVLFRLAPQKPHKIKNMTFINVDAQVTSDVANRIQGHSGYEIEDVTFTNLTMNGVCINEENYQSAGNFVISNADNIEFNGCESSSIVLYDDVLDVKVYPNPVNVPDNLIIELKGSNYNNDISIYSLSGIKLYEQTLSDRKVKIPVNGFKPGTYIIKIANNKASFVNHFIVGSEN